MSRPGGERIRPAATAVIETGELVLESVGLTLPLATVYRGTRLA